MIDSYQRKDKEVVAKLKRSKYHTEYFCGGGIVVHMETM